MLLMDKSINICWQFVDGWYSTSSPLPNNGLFTYFITYKVKFMSMFQSLMNDCFFWGGGAKTVLDWLSLWIVVGVLSDLSSVIVLNSALRYKASWLVNEIAMNSALHVDKVTEFCFLDFDEIIGLFSANQKQNPLTLFLSLKLAQSASQNSNFKGFCNFLNISDWLCILNNVRRVLPLLNVLRQPSNYITNVWSCCNHYTY